MIFKFSCNRRQRRGAVAPMAALLAAFMIGMVAFAVDLGWMVLVKSDLQNAADSAALAGVKPLMDGYVQYQLTVLPSAKVTVLNTALANARTYAKRYAGYNAAGGVNSLTLNDSDIEFGVTDASGAYTAISGTSTFPNTIKVILRRDSSSNGALGLYFAPIFGITTVSLNASAAACMYGGTANSFVSNPTANVSVLPITYDKDSWQIFTLTGLDPDGRLTTYNGYPALQIYPSIKAPGNFGQLSLDASHVGASVEIDWVNNGVASSDISGLKNANLIPLSSHDTTKWDWQGDTGLKQSLISAINAKAGQQFVLPLFNPYSDSPTYTAPSYSAGTGQGSNYFFQITQFVGIVIVPSNGNVIVQPVAMVDANITYTGGSPVPVGTGGATGLVTTFAAPKLTQ
ncbi:MAG TPA: TadE/TadG family type IV pilus assembly protein [Gemmataceae bacterium]|nr:TadE/TadG family type IV pilus assembly protein [Gemmataceae bacterium]